VADELSELKENAEHGSEGNLAPVTVTMAIFAVFVAAVSLLGHRSDTEALLAQTRSTDQWAYYQAIDTRLDDYEIFLDQLTLSGAQAAQISTLREKYDKDVERYTDQEKEIEKQAREAESEVATNLRKADRFDLGEVLLEAALVICSITLLTRKRIFWLAGLLFGAVGISMGVAGLLVH
jgi:hypothetical protein